MKTLIAINSVTWVALFVMAAMFVESTEKKLREERASRVTLEAKVEKMNTMLKKAGYSDQEYWH